MSLFKDLRTYTWNGSFDHKPFQIKVFARNPEEARCEVFAVLAEIARAKKEYEAIEKEIAHRDKTTAPPVVKKTWAQMAKGVSIADTSTENLRKRQKDLVEGIPADFFNGCFAASTFDYTADAVIGFESETLGDFIRTTEPKCSGRMRFVSFASCLDG